MSKSINHTSISQEEFDQIVAVLNVSSESLRPEFERLVNKLSDNQKGELVGIAWLGRGDLEDWREIFTVQLEPTHVATYLSEKGPILKYLQTGWSKIPGFAKFSTPEDYRNYINPILAEPTTKILDAILQAVEHISEQTKDYLEKNDNRPSIDRDFLLILNHIDTIYSFVLSESAIESPWYHEKVDSLKKSAKFLVETWLIDPKDPILPDGSYGGLNRKEWIRERLDHGLSGVRRYAITLREAVVEDGVNLISVKS